MRPIAEIRHENLERLIDEAGSASRLANLAGTSNSYLSQLRNHIPSPAGRPRRIGNRLAGMLERAMGKPDGWLDERHPDTAGAERAGESAGNRCPLLSWKQVAEWATGKLRIATDLGQTLPCPVRCGPEAFVVRAHDASMTPRIQAADLLFVDPDRTPCSGHYVLVRPGPVDTAVIRQLIVDGAHRYLRALNPEWPHPIIEIESTADIRGIVIFKGESLQPAKTG